MRIRRGFLNWGIFLIFLGAVPAAVQLGMLDRNVANDLLRLWPLILVGIGLGLLLRFTALEALGGVVTAGTFGLLVGVLLAGGVGAVSGACLLPEPGSAALETRRAPFAGDEARLDVELSCARLTIDGQGGPDWVVGADFASGQPSLDMQPERLDVHDGGMGVFGGSRSREVQVSLPTAPTTIAYLTLNASKGTVEFGPRRLLLFSGTLNASDMTLQLGDADMSGGPVNMTLNASSVTVTMPTGGTGSASSITVNASSLTLCTAPTVELRIEYEGRLSSDNFAQAGLTRAGGVWQTDGYQTSATGIDMRVSANVSSITLDRSGGCP